MKFDIHIKHIENMQSNHYIFKIISNKNIYKDGIKDFCPYYFLGK